MRCGGASVFVVVCLLGFVINNKKTHNKIMMTTGPSGGGESNRYVSINTMVTPTEFRDRAFVVF